MSESEMDDLRPGDAVLFHSGVIRVVRTVDRWPRKPRSHLGRFREGTARTFGFAIRVCSWTHRGCTFLSRSDMRMRAKVRVKRGMPLYGTQTDRDLMRDIADTQRRVDCCAAKALL